MWHLFFAAIWYLILESYIVGYPSKDLLNWADSDIFKNPPILFGKVKCFLLNFLVIELYNFQTGSDPEKTSPHLHSHLNFLILSLLPYPISNCSLQYFKHSCECLVNPVGSWIRVKSNQINCISDWSVPSSVYCEIHWYVYGHRVGPGRRLKGKEGAGLFQHQN